MSKTKITTWVFALLLVSAGIAALAGCDIGDVLRVNTPNTIQQQTGLPAKTTLNEAEAEYQAWYADVQRSAQQWTANIERANEVRGLLNQFTLSALDEYGPMLGGIPVVGPALPLLAGLGGLFLGASKLRKEKEASFNKGLAEGRAKA